MAQCVDAHTIDLLKNPSPDISSYEAVGLASGVYFGALHKHIQAFAEQTAFGKNQKVFFVATCGGGFCNCAKSLQKRLSQRGIACLGAFQCRGYDTYGLFGKLGGIAKGHPNEKDLEKANAFITRILQR